MAAAALQILDAQIVTRKTAWSSIPSRSPILIIRALRRRSVRVGSARRLRRVLTGRQSIDAVMRRGARLNPGPVICRHRQPTEVRIDNETSDRFTILDVFADDRQGLLYIITNAIFQLGLSVQPVPDFHRARSSGRRVLRNRDGWEEGGRRRRLETIRASILNEIELFWELMRRKRQGGGEFFYRRLKGGGMNVREVLDFAKKNKVQVVDT